MAVRGDIGLVHPEIIRRLEVGLHHPRLLVRPGWSRVWVRSGARTEAEQWVLYRRYQAGDGALACYPSPRCPHMVKPDGYGSAVDLDFAPYVDEPWLLEPILNDVGLIRTVPSEWWHYQLHGSPPFVPPPTDLPLPEGFDLMSVEFDALMGEVKALRMQVADAQAKAGDAAATSRNVWTGKFSDLSWLDKRLDNLAHAKPLREMQMKFDRVMAHLKIPRR